MTTQGAVARGFGWVRGAFAANVGGKLANLFVAVVWAGAIWLFWMSVEPSPVKRVEVVRVEPDDHVIDRSQHGTLTVYRRVVMSRTAPVQIIRVWIDAQGGMTPTLDDFIVLEEGDKVRDPVRVAPPATLREGKHRYRVSMRWCNSLGTQLGCKTLPLEDVEVYIKGDTPPSGTDRSFQEHRF